MGHSRLHPTVGDSTINQCWSYRLVSKQDRPEKRMTDDRSSYRLRTLTVNNLFYAPSPSTNTSAPYSRLCASRLERLHRLWSSFNNSGQPRSHSCAHRHLLRPAASTSKVNTHCFESGLRDSQSVIRSLLLNIFQARRHRLVLPLCNTSLILFQDL